MRRKRIAVDIDDVLSEFAESFVEYSNNKYGTTLKAEDFGENLEQIWGVDGEEVTGRIIEMNKTRICRGLGQKDHSKEVLEELKHRYDLYIVTFRIQDIKADTIVWIKEKYPGIFCEDRIYFGGSSSISDNLKLHSKGELVKKLDIDYLIDDQIRHCLSAALQGVKALLFGNSLHNKCDSLPDNVYRVSDWLEVKKFFDNEK